MKLSMSILAWYMREYNPICSIKNDMISIGGIRFLTGESILLSPDYLYLGTADNFFADPKFHGVYVAVHCQSYLLFYGCEYDTLLNTILSSIDFYEKWELNLSMAAADHAPLQKFMELAEQVMDDFMVVCNMETELLASTYVNPKDIKGTTWEYFFANKRVSQISMNSLVLDSNGDWIQGNNGYFGPRMIKSSNPNTCDKIIMYLQQDGEVIGYLSVNQTSGSHMEMELQLIPVIAEYMLMASEFTSGQSSVRSTVRFFSDLVNGIVPEDEVLEVYQMKIAIPVFRIVYFVNKWRRDMIYARTLLKFLRSYNIICCEHQNGIAALVDDRNCRKNVEELIVLSGFRSICCGISVSANGFHAIGRQIRQAVFVTEQVDYAEGIFCCEDYAFKYMLNVLLEDESVPYLLHPAIDKLYAYDQENQNELLLTLKVYLEKNKSMQKTLEALNIHRSTLKYRIQRIENIIGINLENTEDEKYLRLSIWMKFYGDSLR